MRMRKLKWILLAIVLGVLVTLGLKQLMKTEGSSKNIELEHRVYTTKIKLRSIAPLIQGFGVAKAKVQWQGLSQIKGSIVYKYDKLSRGAFIKKDTLLLKIDPTPYDLALATAIAHKAEIQTEFDKLSIEKEKLTLALKLEKSNLSLEKREYRRQNSLSKSGTISKSHLEKQQRIFTIQSLKVKDLHAQLQQIPARLNAIKASNSQAESQIQQAELNLTHTKINMPFDGRIEQINVEDGEYCAIGQTLLTAQDHSLMEVEAKVPIYQLQRLSATFSKSAFLSVDKYPNFARLNLPVHVEFHSALRNASWEGWLAGISGQVDLNVGTIGVLVEIPVDLKSNIQLKNKQLPLTSGMFVEVMIQGVAKEHFVIPKKALHGDRLYLVDKNNRLKIQAVDVLFTRGAWVVIGRKGVDVGDVIITTDILPATTGIKVKVMKNLKMQRIRGE
ncbi:MAG: efflux RND transporter periplasmic adaptor subunit [Psychromonas sp.]|nr:efflux RND transporter periplasmic adaptor subunit [Psychromonas sp.]